MARHSTVGGGGGRRAGSGSCILDGGFVERGVGAADEVADAAAGGVVDGEREGGGAGGKIDRDLDRALGDRRAGKVAPRCGNGGVAEGEVAPGVLRGPVELARELAGLHVVGVAVRGEGVAGGGAPEELQAEAHREAGGGRGDAELAPRDAQLVHVAAAVGRLAVGGGEALAELGSAGLVEEHELLEEARVPEVGGVHRVERDRRHASVVEPRRRPERAVAGEHAKLHGVRDPAAAGIEGRVHAARHGRRVAPLEREVEVLRVPHRGRADRMRIAHGGVAKTPDAA